MAPRSGFVLLDVVGGTSRSGTTIGHGCRQLGPGGERFGHDGLHGVLAELVDQAGLHRGGLQRIDGVMQTEIAIAPQAWRGPRRGR